MSRPDPEDAGWRQDGFRRPPKGGALAPGKGGTRIPVNLATKVRLSFLLFLLLVLALGAALVVFEPGQGLIAKGTSLAASGALAALSVYRYRRLPNSVTCDIGAAVLIIVIGLGMGAQLQHLFGLSFVHLFLRALDVSLPRVTLNVVLHPVAYFVCVTLHGGVAQLAEPATLTNLVGYVFVGGLMHTLARSFVAQEQLQAEISFQALHDPLTDLPNRTLLNDRLEQALARCRRAGTRIAFVFVDLDDFKEVNDRLGHTKGDRLLVDFALRLAAHLRATDTAARLGGDEFALLIEGVERPEEALVAADRVRAALQTPFLMSGEQISMSASFGIALSEPASTPDELLHHADVAMYAAKDAGKNQCRVYERATQTTWCPRPSDKATASVHPSSVGARS